MHIIDNTFISRLVASLIFGLFASTMSYSSLQKFPIADPKHINHLMTMLLLIIIIISLFQEDNIFGTNASLTYGPRLQK